MAISVMSVPSCVMWQAAEPELYPQLSMCLRVSRPVSTPGQRVANTACKYCCCSGQCLVMLQAHYHCCLVLSVPLPLLLSTCRFINCDPQTGAYTNNTALAQQSCSSATGFRQGDKYFNNFGNLMSYGDKSCLRTLTAGQGARARCAIKCMRQMAC